MTAAMHLFDFISEGEADGLPSAATTWRVMWLVAAVEVALFFVWWLA